jgi:UDP-N-acetylglucosamine:LPS N-acetylglucosamine transferase
LTGIENQGTHRRRLAAEAKFCALKVCLTASTGGHLSELEAFADVFARHETFLVTTPSPYSASVMPTIRRRYVRRIARNPANLIVNFFESVRIVLQEKPDVIVSTGAGDSVSLMCVAASLGIPVVFAESMARVSTMSLTGRIVRRWVTLTLVQWRSLLGRYPRAVWVSSSIQLKRPVQPFPASPSIVVLTGTAEHGFDRLLRGLDQLIEGGKLPSTIFAQIGHSEYLPRNYAYVRFLPHSRLIDAIRACDLVITHDGAASMREALSLGKRTIVFPRRSRAGELAYRSNLELASHLAGLGWVEVVEDPLDIPKVLASATIGGTSYETEEGRQAKEVLSEFLDSVERGVTGTGDRNRVQRLSEPETSGGSKRE